jgi:predicted thioesterase
MNRIYEPGDIKIFKHIVNEDDVAGFHGHQVHPVYATFALARDVEWSSRLFVLDVCDTDEEGIGTMLNIKHINPAFVGEKVVFTAQVESFANNDLFCSVKVQVGKRLVAVAETGQKILKINRLEKIWESIRKENEEG